MKTINLKKYYYPICKKDTFVEVPDEVADAIVEASRAEDANDAKQHYHCYSLDASPGIENHFPEQAISPEDILMEKETEREQEAARALMMERLRETLATLTPRQASCLHARFWEGKPFKKIAEAEGFTTSAAYTNRALEAAGQPALVDHRSYKRRGIDKIPSVHLGPAASQMEKRGIRTDKGEVNRQIAADNKLLKEIKARITRLYNWSKAEAEKPEGQQPSMIDLWEAQQQLKRPDTRTGKIRALQESAALFSFLQANGIQSMQQLHEKISDMNTRYYDLRREIVKAERRIAVLTERGEMWAQYNEYKTVHKQLARVKPEKRELFEQRHSRELILYDAAARYLKALKASEEELSPKEWRREIDLLTAQKQVDSIDMKAMREELKAVERLRKAADQLARQERDKPRDRGPER